MCLRRNRNLENIADGFFALGMRRTIEHFLEGKRSKLIDENFQEAREYFQKAIYGSLDEFEVIEQRPLLPLVESIEAYEKAQRVLAEMGIPPEKAYTEIKKYLLSVSELNKDLPQTKRYFDYLCDYCERAITVRHVP